MLVSFLAGMFLGVLFGSVNVLGGYAGFVFGFILASVPVYIIVHLILYRGFSKLIKTSIPLGALIIVSCVGVALCCFDAFGYNSYVPKTQDIKSAGFYDANSNYQAKVSAVGKNLKDMADDITDKDTIANILEAHYQLVDNRNYSVKNKFKNTWVSMFKDNVPVFSEIQKIPITHLPTLSTTVTSLQEHTALHRLLTKQRAIFQALITNLTHPTSFIQRAISRHTVRL